MRQFPTKVVQWRAIETGQLFTCTADGLPSDQGCDFVYDDLEDGFRYVVYKWEFADDVGEDRFGYPIPTTKDSNGDIEGWINFN